MLFLRAPSLVMTIIFPENCDSAYEEPYMTREAARTLNPKPYTQKPMPCTRPG